MSYPAIAIAVLLVQALTFGLLACTKFGAGREIEVRGVAGCGIATIKVARGEASMSDRVAILFGTVAGAFITPSWIIVAGVIALPIYFLAR